MIEFNGKQYRIVEIDISNKGYRVIGPESLEDAIFKDSVYVSDEAKRVDDAVFFYVPDHMLDGDLDLIKKYVETCLYAEPEQPYQ